RRSTDGKGSAAQPRQLIRALRDRVVNATLHDVLHAIEGVTETEAGTLGVLSELLQLGIGGIELLQQRQRSRVEVDRYDAGFFRHWEVLCSQTAALKIFRDCLYEDVHRAIRRRIKGRAHERMWWNVADLLSITSTARRQSM